MPSPWRGSLLGSYGDKLIRVLPVLEDCADTCWAGLERRVAAWGGDGTWSCGLMLDNYWDFPSLKIYFLNPYLGPLSCNVAAASSANSLKPLLISVPSFSASTW